ncbi:hypothetical protein VARIO8X_160248 [Burkholderiales bacterium 8X]|nr:hypothetical protein VARIO8X_160248 [Burkholderiales bacterium 8X]
MEILIFDLSETPKSSFAAVRVF